MPIKYPENGLIKRPNKKMNFTPEQIQEIVKCSKDVIYFAEKYFTITTPEGTEKIKLYDYQKELLKSFMENQENIVLSSRQSGKCLLKDVNITIRNKITGLEENITIGEFFNLIKNKQFPA